MRHRTLTTALIALAVAAVPAAARTGSATGLHDARYCEILELKGAPPNAQAVVWNTINLNRCPAAWWNAFDAGSLAKELGDTLVLLNGPRHFLMDSASAVVGKVRSFHGQRLTRVASVPIHTAADLDQTPYKDRTIARTNTWSWNSGRRVFELVAPGGDTYVMQSYAQFVDTSLTLAKLPGLASKLTLPAGWRYRSRTLKAPLVLKVHGAATITQDNLKNTYQLEKATRPAGPRTSHAVSVDGQTKEVSDPQTQGTIEDHGTLTGSPFGPGTVVVVGKLDGGAFNGTFRMLFKHGSVLGTASMPYTITGNEIDFQGTGQLTGATGIYRGITSGQLTIHDHNTLDGQNGVLHVGGSATY